MNCREVRDVLGTYLDGGEDEGTEARVRTHLETCEECRAHLSQLQSLATQLRAVPERLEPVHHQLATAGTHAQGRLPGRRFIAVAAILAAWGLVATAALVVPSVTRVIPFGPASEKAQQRTERANSDLQAENARLKEQLTRARAFALSPELVTAVRRYVDRAFEPSSLLQREFLGRASNSGSGADARRVELRSALGFQRDRSALVRAHVAVYLAGRGTPRIVDLDVSLSQDSHGAWHVTHVERSR